ncbi:CCA tRNA nucleotidyltransferase 1, mitochondrial-like isoform X1 [Varroa destructor]|uniref:CCA tRNA nucleotidyltransferase 1, mitochondrial n=1 Tax=Varroa destructor TaxID=109461 RepID=A0A7M7JC93_VARDE|nr:CCA tRNA nucleotidyltransferase 1, mitochondrial-like isoform X1 [Varroa destructor]
MLLRSSLSLLAVSPPLWSSLIQIGCARCIKLIRKDLMAPLAGELRTMKISNDLFKSIITPEMKILEELFRRNNFELRIAGGAVRDLLMNTIPHDLDFATTATPDEMKRIFTDEDIRMINTNGEKHGTITARINDKENFEVTTLRIDVITDGRHAEVQFTTDWQTDANRRDLTVNAMFLSLDGVVYDYFKGIEHIKQRKVLFVGDAALRIQEDYLRILRYFRFYGRLALNENSHDPDTLEAIRLNTNGLEGVSGERLSVEFRKILEGPLYCPLICLMYELSVTPYLGLPKTPDLAEFRKVCQQSENLQPAVMTRLAGLLHSKDDVLAVHGRLRLSNAERNLLLFLVRYRPEAPKGSTDDDLRFCQTLQFTCDIKGGSMTEVWYWTEELLKYHGNKDLLQKFREWKLPRFPVTGHKLIELGIQKGPKVGWVMTRMRQIWFDSSFLLNEEQLLSKLGEILQEVPPKRK